MTDWFEELRMRARRALGTDGEQLARVVWSAFEGERDASRLERAAIALAGIAAASVGLALGLASLLGLALATAILYLVLTRVFGFDLKLDPEALFGGLRVGHSQPEGGR